MHARPSIPSCRHRGGANKTRLRTAASAYHSIMLAFALLCCAGSVALSPSPDMCACGVAANRMSELPHKALLPAESHLVQLWCAWQARRTPG